jgi:hypothetical protein
MSAALALCIGPPAPSVAASAGPSCGEHTQKSDSGIVIKILFAKNGAVQRYEIVDAQENTEQANDEILKLEKIYGEAGVDAPPLHIVSFKPAPGGGGMMVPDKAIDSCGRTLSFQ